jgi:hypothetical protein
MEDVKSASSSATPELLEELRELDRSLDPTVNKNDRVIVLITALIDAGVNTRSQIVGVLTNLAFDRGHVALQLKHGTGDNPDRFRWRAEAGMYRNHG